MSDSVFYPFLLFIAFLVGVAFRHLLPAKWFEGRPWQQSDCDCDFQYDMDRELDVCWKCGKIHQK